MKKILALALLSGSVYIAHAQSSFEGMIAMIPDFRTSPSPKNKMIYYVKGDKVAMDMNAGGDKSSTSRMVGDMKTREYYILSETDRKKIAVKMNIDQPMMMSPGMTSGNPKTEDKKGVQPTTRVTGETRVKDGYNC